MRIRAILLSMTFAMSIALEGCLSASTITPTRYYTVTASPAVEAKASTGKSLGIRPLIGAKPYKLAIAYTAADNRLAYFLNAEWADLPATVMNRCMTDGLTRLGAFSEVDDAANIARPALILTGELRRFEADYNRENPVVIVEVSCIVRDTESDNAVWQGYLTAETPLPASARGTGMHSDENLAAVAEAMGQSVGSVVEQACKAIGGSL